MTISNEGYVIIIEVESVKFVLMKFLSYRKKVEEWPHFVLGKKIGKNGRLFRENDMGLVSSNSELGI